MSQPLPYMTVLLHPQQLLKYTPKQQFESPPKANLYYCFGITTTKKSF